MLGLSIYTAELPLKLIQTHLCAMHLAACHCAAIELQGWALTNSVIDPSRIDRGGYRRLRASFRVPDPISGAPGNREILVMIDLNRLNGDAPSAQIDEFGPGDTVTVNLRIIEGDRQRIQAFQGNVIAGRFHPGRTPSPTDSFTVRRLSYGVGVERIIPFWSPNLESVKVTRHGAVRQSRLYFLRGRTGKRARIKERRRPVAAKR